MTNPSPHAPMTALQEDLAAFLDRCPSSTGLTLRAADGDELRVHADMLKQLAAAAAMPSSLLTDEQVIDRCEAAGMKWLPPDDGEDGFPGGFDLSSLADVRRLLASAPPVEPATASDAPWRELFWKVALALNCLPSTFVDANAHVLRAAQRMPTPPKEGQALRGGAPRQAAADDSHVLTRNPL